LCDSPGANEGDDHVRAEDDRDDPTEQTDVDREPLDKQDECDDDENAKGPCASP